MELRQLNYFIAISDAKSFTRAAEKLYVSQPALTGQINALENELGMKLFDRTNKSVQLTPAGEVFYKHATQVLSEVENTLSHVQTIRQNAQSTLCFAVHPIFSGAPFLAIYSAVQSYFPNRQILFDIADLSSMESAQNRRRYSFRIFPGFADQSSKEQLLAESPFLFAATDKSVFSSDTRLYLVPSSTRLSGKLTELLPDNASISLIPALDRIEAYMELSDTVVLLPQALVPQGVVCQNIPNAPRLGVLLTCSAEQMKEPLTKILRQTLANRGWERNSL